MSGIGYQWVRGKMIYGAQLGVGYSFNKVTLNAGASDAFGGAGAVQRRRRATRGWSGRR